MVLGYSMFMRRTDLLDEKTTVYTYGRKSPGKFYCKPFWDYIDFSIVNSFIVYQEIFKSTKHKVKNEKIIKTKRLQESCSKWIDWEFFIQEERLQGNRHCNRRHRIEYAKKHGRCNWYYVQEKLDHNVFVRCLECNVYLCLNKNRNCWETQENI